ncbi:MAG: ice-binding family protein [Bacteroidota bacterium]|nr:ice-binding family protein [Bacteroidota bacterium]
MKKALLFYATFATLLIFPKLNFGQVPDFGAASGFAVFSSAGAFTNVGPTTVTGDVGNNAGAFTAFPPGILTGQIHNIDVVSGQAATDLASANSTLLGTTCGTTIGAALGSGQILTQGIYCQSAAVVLTGDLILDAQGDPNAIFILKFDATFTTAAASNLILINSASLCNVYWHSVGAVVLGTNSTFGGTIISNGAVTLADGAALSGRAFTTAGAISLTNNTINIAAAPVAAVISAGSPITFCFGDSVILSGNTSGVWSTTETTPSITVNTSNDYFVTNSNAFCSSTSNHILVTVNPLPTANAGNNSSICNGSSTTLGSAAIAGNSYLWTPATGLSSSVIANPIANPTTTTTYTLIETITATGCENSNSVTLTVDDILIASVITASGPTTFCGDENVILSGNTGGTWSNTASVSTPSLTVNTSGNYFVTNSNTCNTVTSNSIVVTVNPQALALTGGNVTICNGTNVMLGAASIPGHSYSWLPTTGLSSATISNPVANPSDTTIYSLTETINASGCSKTNSVTVTVNPLPLATTGSDASICTSILLGTTPIVGHTYSWTPVTGLSSATISNPIASPSATETYFLTETITSTGCVKTNSVNIIVNPLPLAITGNNTTFCNGNSVTLGTTAISGHTYVWSPTTALNSTSIANPVASPTVTETYSLTETITLTGCQKTNSVTITVNPLPLAITGSNASICDGNSITLGTTSITGHTYSWTPAVGLISASLSNPVASPSTLTTFTLTESITATGCVNTNSVTITVTPIPAAFTGTNAIICKDDGVTLGGTAIAGNTYLWSPSTGLSIATISNPIASPASTETYSLLETITSTGCFLINYVDVTVNPLPLAVTGSNTSVCVGSSVTLGTSAVSGNTYSWSPVAGLSSGTSAQPFASPLTPTTYTLTETITSTGCQKTNSVVIAVNPLPSATTINGGAICAGDSVAIGGNSTSGNTYIWSPITNLNSPTISNPMASPTVTVIYTLTETIIATGCSESNSLTVEVNAAPTIVSQPTNQIVSLGSSAEFSVDVTGTNLTYQWRKGLVNLTNNSTTFGVNTDTLRINPVSISDTSNSYNVVISGICFISNTSQNTSLSITGTIGIASSGITSKTDAVTIFPNPFTNLLNVVVHSSFETNLEVIIYTTLGEKIIHKILSTESNTIDTRDLSSGMYFYSVQSKNKIIQSGKLICN